MLNRCMYAFTCVCMCVCVFACGSISYEKCKSMDSKMKPLWLVWKNMELAAGTKEFESLVMFKKGDGLCCESRLILVFLY